MIPPLPFVKAQALGNDFVIIHAPDLPLTAEHFLTPERVRTLADRRQGIGCDQAVVYQQKPNFPQNHWDVLFYNADGSVAQACGNGSRCLVLLLADMATPDVHLHTPSGKLTGHRVPGVTTSEQIPHLVQLTFPKPKILGSLSVLPDLSLLPPIHVCAGNPHLIFEINCPPTAEMVMTHGPALERALPGGVNVSFAYPSSPGTILLNVWERGAGFTPACGTAACAVAAVMAKKKGITPQKMLVHQPGGDLEIIINKDTLTMTGTAALVYTGQFFWEPRTYTSQKNSVLSAFFS